MIVIAVTCVAAQSSIDSSPLPKTDRLVNDFVGVLGAAKQKELEDKLRLFMARTQPKVVIAVAIVKTTGDQDIFDYSLSVARGWKIGTKESDNPSALLLIAVEDRKYFTQVSRDLEDELPDGLVGRLGREFLVPSLRKGDYEAAVSDTLDAYMATIAEKAGLKDPDFAKPKKKKSDGIGIAEICFGAFMLLLFVIFALGSRGRGRGGRGGGGVGDVLLPMLIGMALNSSNRGGWSGGSSGGWGGGDFGGFGGGDFGGGGAGGSW